MSWAAVEGTDLRVADYRVPGLPCRSAAVSLNDGTELVFSPGAALLDAFVEEGREASVLVTCNSYHHMGLAKWKARFPDATVCAGRGALARLAKKGQRCVADIASIQDRLPAGVSIIEVPSTRIGEVWLRSETDEGVSWVVGDSFFNMRAARRLGPRTLQRVAKSGPGLSMSHLMKWGGLSDRAAFRRWFLAQLDADRPRVLVPMHGEICASEEICGELRRLVDRRL